MFLETLINLIIIIGGGIIVFFIFELLFEGFNISINKIKNTKNEDYFYKYTKLELGHFIFSLALGIIWIVLSFLYLIIPGSLEVLFGGLFELIKSLLNLTLGNVLFGILYLIFVVPLGIIIIGIYLFGPVWLASKMKDKLVFSNNLFYKNNEKVINIIAGFFYVLWLISPGWIINQFI